MARGQDLRQLSTRALLACVPVALWLACSRSTTTERSAQHRTHPQQATSLVAKSIAPEPERPPPRLSEGSASSRSQTTATPTLSFVQLTTGGALSNDSLPWIVAFHGLGDRPETFRHLFDQLQLRAHVYLPRAPITYGTGFDWYGVRIKDDSDALSQAIEARLPAVRSLLSELASRPNNVGDAVVTGFSQGGVLSFAIALAHLPHVRAALPIAGTLPKPLSDAKPPTIPVIAFHGERDRVVPFAQTEALFERWTSSNTSRTNPTPLELHTYPTLAHSIDASLWQDWSVALRQTLAL